MAISKLSATSLPKEEEKDSCQWIEFVADRD